MLTQSRITKEIKACLFLAIPLAAAQLAQSATGFVDTVMMGVLGSQALAAGGLGTGIFVYLLMVSSGIVSAVSPLVAEAYGAEDARKVGRVTRQGLWLAAFFSVPLTVLVWNAAPLLRVVGQSEAAIALTESYLKAIAWGMFPGLMFAVLRSTVTALSHARIVMGIVLLGTAVNAVGNYILATGKFGFPALGLAGIGWASVLSLWSMLLILIGYIWVQPGLKSYTLFRSLHRFEPDIFWELVRVGLPIGGLISIEGGMFTLATFLMAQFGTATLAAHQVALQSAAIAFNVPLGVSFAATIRVGQLLGQKDFRGVRLAGLIGIALGALFMCCTALLFWTNPEGVVGLYLDVQNPANADVIQVAKTMLGIAAIFQIVDGIQVVAAGALRGLKDTRTPMLVAFLAYWCVGLTTGLTFAYGFGIGGSGIWWGMAAGLAMAAVVLTTRFSRLSQLLRSPNALHPSIHRAS